MKPPERTADAGAAGEATPAPATPVEPVAEAEPGDPFVRALQDAMRREARPPGERAA